MDDGEFVFLVGPSGSGKSTIIKLMTGEVVPTAGRVMVNGFSMSRIAEKQIPYMRRTIGVIFQDFRLIGNKTVRDNLALAMRAVGASPRELKNRIPYVLELVGLADKENSYPDQLSGGEQQRVAIARILASEPRAILLDEPFSALDSFLKWNLEMELTEVLDSFAGPAIWVSHDRGEAFRNCRWVCVMDQGKTLPAQAMDELFFSPGTEAAARLTGCKNYARAITNGNTVTLPEWGIALRCAEKAGSMVQCVGIRAHSVRPATLGEENAFSCTVERIIQDVFSTIILLRPVGATQEAPLLWMEMDKNNGQKIHNSRTLTVAVAPQQIMLLH